MVIAYHLIWTVYGSWLPNDPRGSMSKIVRNDLLADLGTLHHGRKRAQPAGRVIRDFYTHAASVLKYPLLTFNEMEMRVVADAFETAIRESGYTCYACAIMPDHVHVVTRKHRHKAEKMIGRLQASSHLALRAAGFRDLEHPVWGGPGWKVFLDSPDEVRRTMRYVKDNPIKARLPAQDWSFVQPYDGWAGSGVRTR